MIRISAIALALVFVFVLFGSVSAHAQTRTASASSSSTTPAATTSPVVGGIFSKSSIEHVVAKTMGSSTVVPRSNKSFWKGLWPWVIGGAVVVLALVFAGNSNGTGSVY